MLVNNEFNFTTVDFDPFAGKEIEKIAITNEPQKEIWLSCVLGGNDANLAYNESVSLAFEGRFNRQAFEQALQQLVARHEALRSTVSTNGESLIIYKDLSPDINFFDLSHLDKKQQDDNIQAFLHNEMTTPFDLTEGPLLRISVHKFSDTTHYFTLVIHHIVGDGWSLGIILQDLGKLYSAYAKGESIDLPAAPQISDYANEQAIYDTSKEHDAIQTYWLDQYKDDVPVLNLPTDHPRPSPRSYKSHRLDFILDKDLVNHLKTTGAKAGCSFVSTLLSTFEIFLYHKTGQKDIVLGLPAAGQSATGNYGLVGHCVNLLPLRSTVNADLSFNDYLKKHKGEILDAYDNQRFTFGQLIKKLNIKRDSTRIPLVPVVFNIDMGMDDGVSFHELTYRLIYNPREYESFEIFLNATGSDQSLILEWSYNTQLFNASSIHQMMEEFKKLVTSVTINPAIKIKDIALAGNEWNSKLKEWNDTFSPYPSDISFIDLLNDTVQAYPDKVALSYKDEKITFKKLEEITNQFAGFLLKNEVKPGDKIGLAVDRSSGMIISLIAILKAGAAYIPLDPEYPQERIEFMLSDSSASILLTSKKYKGKFTTNAKELLIEDIWSDLSKYSTTNVNTSVTGNDLAYVLYTSGSTGKPKGVQIEHHNLVNFLLSMQKEPGIKADDRLLAITTISFDIAGLEMYLPLISGAQLILADAETAKDGRLLLKLIADEKISIMQATPSTWKMILESGWEDFLPVKILCGGEALPKELTSKLLTRCNELWNMYGPTETTIWSTTKRITKDDERITIGKPIDNTKIYILDENMKLMAPGATGEILIGGEGVARGYLNRPELTAEKFVHINSIPGELLYRTGDLGCFMEDGEIQCLGRIDEQVKIRGYRIELGEIEFHLSQQAEINKAVVIAREDKPGQQRLVAYIVPAGNQSYKRLTTEAVYSKEQLNNWKQKLNGVLPHYMIPDDWVFIETIPLTPNNKIDRKALPKPEYGTTQEDKKQNLPRTAGEKMIAAIWSEALGIEKINIDEDFFELGGHSLIAVQVMARIEKETGKRLPLTSLFDSPTIEKLSRLFDDYQKDVISWKSLLPINSKGTKPPLYVIHGGGLTLLVFNLLTKNLAADQPVYGLQPKGLNGVDEPLSKMEDIAAHYVSEVLENNPNGPYALAGYSFGGLIAIEMARQLKDMGKEVMLVGLFDSFASQSDYHKPFIQKAFNRVKTIFMKVAYTFVLMSKDPIHIIKFRFNSTRANLSNAFNKLNPLKKQPESESFFVYSKKVSDLIDVAYRNYKLTPYNGTIDLFRAQKQMYYLPDVKELGWRPFAKQGLNIHNIPGDHGSIFMNPDVKEFAKKLQECLDEAYQKHITKKDKKTILKAV